MGTAVWCGEGISSWRLPQKRWGRRPKDCFPGSVSQPWRPLGFPLAGTQGLERVESPTSGWASGSNHILTSATRFSAWTSLEGPSTLGPTFPSPEFAKPQSQLACGGSRDHSTELLSWGLTETLLGSSWKTNFRKLASALPSLAKKRQCSPGSGNSH